MSLDHHRAAGSKGRGGVTTGNRKGQREIAGAKHRHGTNADTVLADVRARQGLTVRQSRINAGTEEIAPANQRGKKTQLGAGSHSFTADAWFGEACFANDDGNKRVVKRFQTGGNSFEKAGPFFKAGGAELVKRGSSGSFPSRSESSIFSMLWASSAMPPKPNIPANPFRE